jgi:hypothetical protein
MGATENKNPRAKIVIERGLQKGDGRRLMLRCGSQINGSGRGPFLHYLLTPKVSQGRGKVLIRMDKENENCRGSKALSIKYAGGVTSITEAA